MGGCGDWSFWFHVQDLPIFTSPGTEGVLGPHVALAMHPCCSSFFSLPTSICLSRSPTVELTVLSVSTGLKGSLFASFQVCSERSSQIFRELRSFNGSRRLSKPDEVDGKAGQRDLRCVFRCDASSAARLKSAISTGVLRLIGL